MSIQIVEGGGDYLWLVKENQPTLREEIALLFAPECVCAGWSAVPLHLSGGQDRVDQALKNFE